MWLLLGTADVVGTQVFNRPVPGATEAISSLLVIIVYGALSHVQRQRSHIRMEMLYANAGPRARAVMDLVAHLIALGFFGLMLRQTTVDAAWSWSIKQTEVGLIRFPVYPFKAALAVGLAVLLVTLRCIPCEDCVKLDEELVKRHPDSTAHLRNVAESVYSMANAHFTKGEAELARPWAVPGTPGLRHRIGGLEKEYLTGNVSYAPTNHEQMIRVRARHR